MYFFLKIQSTTKDIAQKKDTAQKIRYNLQKTIKIAKFLPNLLIIDNFLLR